MRMITPYWTTRRLASDLFGEMDRFLTDWERTPTDTQAHDERSFAPACEVIEAEDHYLMSVDLPGMRKEDIQVEIADNILSLSGERKRESSEKVQKFQRYEKSYGFFKRNFALPTSIEANQVEAKYENGVLQLYLPKIQSAKPRRIEIQSGKAGFFDQLLSSKKGSQEVKENSPNKAS